MVRCATGPATRRRMRGMGSRGSRSRSRRTRLGATSRPLWWWKQRTTSPLSGSTSSRAIQPGSACSFLTLPLSVYECGRRGVRAKEIEQLPLLGAPADLQLVRVPAALGEQQEGRGRPQGRGGEGGAGQARDQAGAREEPPGETEAAPQGVDRQRRQEE